MRAEVGGPIVLCTGVMLVRLAVTGDHQKYVRPGMGPYLIVAGVLLVVLGLVTTVQVLLRGPEHEPAGESGVPAEDHGHGHGHRPGHVGGPASYLLVAPLVAVLVFAPPGLGSFAVERSAAVSARSAALPEPEDPFALYDPLTSAEPTVMSLFEFTERAHDRAGASFAGKPVNLTGFVSRQRDGEGFQLARYQIACCAADALSSVVRVVGAGPPPPRDTWVTVTGTFRAMTKDGSAELTAIEIRPVPPPVNPYE